MSHTGREDGAEWQTVDGVRHVVVRTLRSSDGVVIALLCGKRAAGQTNNLTGAATDRCQACTEAVVNPGASVARLTHDRQLLGKAHDVQIRLRHLPTALFYPEPATLRSLGGQLKDLGTRLIEKADEVELEP